VKCVADSLSARLHPLLSDPRLCRRNLVRGLECMPSPLRELVGVVIEPVGQPPIDVSALLLCLVEYSNGPQQSCSNQVTVVASALSKFCLPDTRETITQSANRPAPPNMRRSLGLTPDIAACQPSEPKADIDLDASNGLAVTSIIWRGSSPLLRPFGHPTTR